MEFAIIHKTNKMKTIKTLLVVLAFVSFSTKVNAQMHSTQFCTGIDSANYGGGWFCNQDTFNFYDHSTGPIVQWTWLFHGADNNDTILTYTTFTPMVTRVWSVPGYYRVSLTTIDTFGVSIKCDVGIHIAFAKIDLHQADTLYLPVGNSIVLNATANKYGYFYWSQNVTVVSAGFNDSIHTVLDTGIYTVRIGGGGCGATDKVVVLNPAFTTGIKKNAEDSFSLYPNPAKDDLNIIFARNEKEEIVQVFNITGQLIASLQVSGQQKINVSSFENGIYFCKVGSENTFRKFEVFH